MCITETETELNVEVAFSEQALTYRDNHQKFTTSPNSSDDKLPVSHIPVHTRTQRLYMYSTCRSVVVTVEQDALNLYIVIKMYAKLINSCGLVVNQDLPIYCTNWMFVVFFTAGL